MWGVRVDRWLMRQKIRNNASAFYFMSLCACVRACVRARARASVCVCVCVCEKEREKEREYRERKTERRQRDSHRQTYRLTERLRVWNAGSNASDLITIMITRCWKHFKNWLMPFWLHKQKYHNLAGDNRRRCPTWFSAQIGGTCSEILVLPKYEKVSLPIFLFWISRPWHIFFSIKVFPDRFKKPLKTWRWGLSFNLHDVLI